MVEKRETSQLFISIFLAIAIIFINGFIYAHGDLTTYMTAPMAIADGNIYAQDFSIQEFLRPNAQSFSDYLTAFFLKLGLPWKAFSIAAYFLQTAVFAAGIIAISRHLCKGKNYWLMSSLLLLLSFYATSGLRIGRNPIWYGAFYYAQSGFAAGVWGFYLALRKKWLGAFSLFAVATLLHFTVGAYCAAFVVPFFLYDVIRNREYKRLWTPLVWVGVCVGIFVMMYAAGTTSTGLLSSEQFINIHCYLRHPHHHIPSSWELGEWLNFACYIAGVFFVLRAVLKEDEQKKFLMGFFYATTAMTALILAVNVLFIEIIPVAFIAKIQPARCVFLYRFFLAGLLAYAAVRLFNKKNYIFAAILIFAASFPQIAGRSYGGFFVAFEGFAAWLYAYGQRKDSPLKITLAAIVAACVLVILLWLPGWMLTMVAVYKTLLAITYIMGLMILVILGGVFMELAGNNRRRIYAAAMMALVAVGVFAYKHIDIQGNFDVIAIKSLAGESKPADATGGIEEIAREFKENTPEDALFFGDPYNINTSYFRLYSERSSVIAFKNMPFTDEGMLEWIARLEAMGAVTTGPDGRYLEHDRVFPRMAVADIIDYAKSYHADYILLYYDQDKIDEYVALGCSVFLENDGWAVLEVS